VLGDERLTMMRGLALLLSLPACALGVHALAAVFVPTLPGLTILGEALSRPFAMAGQLPLFTSLQGLVPGAAFLAVGVALLVVGLRRGARASAKGASGAKLEASGESAATDKGAKKIEKRAAALAKKGEVKEAAELCAAHGLSDQAVRYWVQAGDIGKAAGIRQDQNRFKEAAELYLQAGQHDAAAGLYAARGEFERAGDCYRKGGRMSVAAEMYEKAGRHLLAGECYVRCEFYRHAAQAFLKVQDFDKAAKALEKAIEEESQRVGNDRHGARELKKLVVQAGRLYDAAGDFASAARVLERGECWAAAGEIAARNKLFDRAAEYFQRAGNMPKAAEALRALGDDQAAAQVMGEYMRDKGDPEEAARLLVEAGDFGSAGDLYRNREDFKQAAECYERAGDIVQAAEMFRLAQDWERAAASYERLGHWPEAAECAAQAGDAAREAALLTRGGQLLQAGRTWIRAGNDDEAIKVLQQVRQDQSTFREASALLGEIFRKKGKHSLAVKKLQQAIGDAELDAGNIALWYDLATVYETAGMPRQAVEIYEKILTADYHYKDVEQRLEVTRSLARAVAGSEGSGTSQDSLTPNPRPGRYRIVGELGRGGMGIVYKAEDTVLDRIVALKVLPDALRDNPQALKNFLREAKSAAKLNHPNIVTVYDAGEQDGRYYIAMEHVDGTTLKEIVRKRGAIAAKGALNVALQMCEALHYAHAQKIIHRDVKTANTMWTRDKKAKIMDFGLAKVVEEVRNHTTLVSGTPYYMSPEQTLGRPVDHRTDLYSLGVTLFELVTGTLPFREGNVPYHHVHTPAPDPRTANPAVPAGFAEVIGRCLAKEPDQRPQTAREVAQALRAVAG
jgi:tetratricopeptide (TPR) repeat protein